MNLNQGHSCPTAKIELAVPKLPPYVFGQVLDDDGLRPRHHDGAVIWNVSHADGMYCYCSTGRKYFTDVGETER